MPPSPVVGSLWRNKLTGNVSELVRISTRRRSGVAVANLRFSSGNDKQVDLNLLRRRYEMVEDA